MIRKLFLAALPAFLVTVSGCADDNGQAHPVAVVQEDPVSARLAVAAEKAASALDVMSRVEQARSPAEVMPVIPDPPQELRQATTVSWNGPVESVGRLLAELAGYDFIVLGHPPPTPVIVEITAVDEPVIEILRDVGLQMGNLADINVNAQARRIEVHYASNAGQ